MKLLIALLLACASAFGHGVHASLTSIQFNEASKSLEIVMVMSADDVETVLRRDTGKQIEVDRGAEQLVFGYIAKSLEIRGLKLQWVGMEVSVQKITAYLEAKVPSGDPNGLNIRNDLLLDLLNDQVNILSVKRAGKPNAKASEHLFNSRGTWQTVKLP
ncbi:MAG: hypothetical protein JST65_14080 [Acidobacteria bacterium]|nr:hypothetical protein [Acidobacteriota bacterium]